MSAWTLSSPAVWVIFIFLFFYFNPKLSSKQRQWLHVCSFFRLSVEGALPAELETDAVSFNL